VQLTERLKILTQKVELTTERVGISQGGKVFQQRQLDFHHSFFRKINQRSNMKDW